MHISVFVPHWKRPEKSFLLCILDVRKGRNYAKDIVTVQDPSLGSKK